MGRPSDYSFSAEACAILLARQHQKLITSFRQLRFPLFFSFSRSLAHVTEITNPPPFFFYSAIVNSNHSFLPGDDTAHEVRSFSHLQSRVVFFFASPIYSSLFSDILSHSNSSTRRVLLESTGKFKPLHHARSVIISSLLQQTQPYVKLFIFVIVVEFRILHAALRSSDPKLYILFCPKIDSLRRSLFANCFSIDDL